MQAYSDPERETDPHALPNVEVFYVSKPYHGEGRSLRYLGEMDSSVEASAFPAAGWYWHACFPGCLPDGEPSGPFASEAEALADAQGDA